MTTEQTNTPPAPEPTPEQRAVQAIDSLITICEVGIPCRGPNGKLVVIDGKQLYRPAPPAYFGALQRWLTARADVVRALGQSQPSAGGLSPAAAGMLALAKSKGGGVSAAMADLLEHAARNPGPKGAGIA